MALGETVAGPLVGGPSGGGGIVDFKPRGSGGSRKLAPPRRGPAAGASRTRQTISQAGGNFAGTAAREAARRARPVARAAAAARTKAPVARALAPGGVRTPRTGAGGGGGVGLRRGVPTATPRRTPAPASFTQLPTGRAQARQPQNAARQLIAEQEERRRRIRTGGGFQFVQGLRGR